MTLNISLMIIKELSKYMDHEVEISEVCHTTTSIIPDRLEKIPMDSLKELINS